MVWVPPTTRARISPGSRNVVNGEVASRDFGMESPSATHHPDPAADCRQGVKERDDHQGAVRHHPDPALELVTHFDGHDRLLRSA